jgi:cell division septum initiation protein DivIVA
MRQNVEELQSTQEEMSRKQKELEDANRKMEGNEGILRKTLDKTKEREKLLEAKQKEVQELLETAKMQEEEMRNSMQYMAENEVAYKNRIAALESELAKFLAR